MSEFYTNVLVNRGQILVRGYLDGKPFRERVPYKPYHYIRSRVDTDYKNLQGECLEKIDFDSINDARDFLAKYEHVENFDVFGFNKYAYNYISDKYPNMEYDTDKVSVVYMDIEVAADQGFPEAEFADKPVVAIALRKGDLRICVGTVDYKEHEADIVYIKCIDEEDLLFKFIDVWKKLDPDVVSGWNVEFFDIPYLYNRITRMLGENVAKQLSPWLQVREYTQKGKYGREQKSYTLLGITTIDLMAAYIKFSFKNQESFSLNYIAHVELGETKTDYSEYESLHDLYLKNPQLFIEYNIQDNDLVYRINEQTGLIEQIMALAYDAGVNYADAFGSVLYWEVKIKNFLAKKNILVPTHHKKNRKLAPIMGAYVKEPIPNKYKWVVGLDLDSLYPHLIMGYNISPETFVRCIRDLVFQMPIEDILMGKMRDNHTISDMISKGYGFTPNGAFFRNDIRGFLPELMDEMYSDRKRYKRLMIDTKKLYNENPTKELLKLITQYNNIQMSKKIALNSAYGALSNEYCAWYQIDLAEAITYAGQLSIKWIANDLNTYFNKLLKTVGKDYVIASDTDSAYLTLDNLVNHVFPNGAPTNDIVAFLAKVCDEKVNPFIMASYDKLKDYTNAYEQKMSMKVESISEAGIWKAKKRYALTVWWDEGVFNKTPQIKVKGMEAVQSSTPAICRDVMKESLVLMLQDKKDELYKLVDEFEQVFKSSPFEAIADTTSVSDIESYADHHSIYKKGCPIHTRGALLYNKMIKDLKIDHMYNEIHSGDKIKKCYLKTPNPIHENVISIYNRLPPEFNLNKYIDYNVQFEKEFLGPINKIAKLVGWDLTNTATLDQFFG